MTYLQGNVRSKVIYSIIFTLLVGFMLSGFSKSTNAAQKYSGEEIFAGVMLGQGEIAKKFPEIWGKEELKNINSEKSKKEVKNLIKEMKKVNPTYFDSLASAVYSKNPEKVNDSLIESTNILKEIHPELKTANAAYTSGADCVTLYVWTAVVAIWVVAVAGAIVAAPTPDGVSTLSNEMLVKHMVEEFN